MAFALIQVVTHCAMSNALGGKKNVQNDFAVKMFCIYEAKPTPVMFHLHINLHVNYLEKWRHFRKLNILEWNIYRDVELNLEWLWKLLKCWLLYVEIHFICRLKKYVISYANWEERLSWNRIIQFNWHKR